MTNPINLKFPLKKSSKGSFEVNETTLDAVEDDLRILIMTNHGERPIHFDFGANLRKLLFDMRGEDLAQAIKDSIITAVEKWMPFVNILTVQVLDSTMNSNLKENEISIKVEFSVGKIDDTRIFTQQIKA